VTDTRADAIRFDYRACDATGAERRGSIFAASAAAAARELLQQGLTPLDLQEPGRREPAGARRRGRIGEADRIVVLRELATLLQAGVSVGEALPSVADAYEGGALGDVLAGVSQRVNAGGPLAGSLAESNLGLPAYVLALLQAGEAAGDLGPSLAAAADQMDQQRRATEELRNALMYPTLLVVVGIAVITAIFIGVIPRFANLLQNTRADIPELSRQVISAGVFAKQHAWGLAFGGAALVALAVVSFTGPAGRARLIRIACLVPALRRWLFEADLGRWASVLAAMLGNRVGIIAALGLSAAAARVDRVRADVQRLAQELERGRTLASALEDLAWFPRNRLNLVRVGERSGQLAQTLATLGDIHTEAARTRQRRMLTLVEPVAILAIGAAIGFVMVAVMSAITSVNSAGL
jgi:general secretion pathway protein F